MDWLFWLLIVLALITVVGHGIWVLIGSLIRGLGGLVGPSEERPTPAEMCPRCGALWDRSSGSRHCVLCGWDPAGTSPRPPARPEQILLYLERRVERYHRLGLLSTEIRDRLVQAFRVETSPAVAR